MNKFYPLTAIMTDRLRKAKLTEAQWRLWSYLVTIAPFGDKYYQLPDTLEIISVVEISKATFYRAIAKFQQEGLFDFQDQGFKFRNLDNQNRSETGHLKGRTSSPPSPSRVSSRKAKVSSVTIPVSPMDVSVSPMRLDSYPCENQEPEPAPQADSKSSQTIQTIQTLSYSSDPHPPTLRKEERERGENAKDENARRSRACDLPIPAGRSRADGKRNNTHVPISNPVKENSVCEAEIIQEKKSSVPRSTSAIRKTTDGVFGTPKPTREEIMNPYTDGEWMKGNQLDPDFVEWLARTWLSSDEEKFMNIHNAKKCVRLHFLKNQYALPIEWQQYHEETKHRYENAQTRITHGLNIPSEEQAMLASRAKAVVTPIEEFSNPIQVPTTPQPSLSPSVADNILRSPEDGGQYEENASAYQLWQHSDSDPTPEEAAKVLQSLALQMRKIRLGQAQSIEPVKSMPKQTPVIEKLSELEELNAWMSDRILREEAIRRVKASDRYTFEYDDDGSPMSVIEPEF